MHENRETSGAPRRKGTRPVCEGAKPQGGRARSGGVGLHHTIDEPDEQRRAIFGGAWGERVRAKENIVQPNTIPTQSGERVSQGLSGVREVAKKRRQERFTALLHHVGVDLLLDSYYALKRHAAPGVDGSISETIS